MPLVICASDLLKEAVAAVIAKSDMTTQQMKEEAMYWDSLPACKDGRPIQSAEPKRRGRQNTDKPKRAPSAYNLFIGDCMRGQTGDRTENFKQCVVDWNQQKQ